MNGIKIIDKEQSDRDALLAQKLYFSMNRHLGVLCRDYNKLIALANEINLFVETHLLDDDKTISAEVTLLNAHKLPPLKQKTMYREESEDNEL